MSFWLYYLFFTRMGDGVFLLQASPGLPPSSALPLTCSRYLLQGLSALLFSRSLSQYDSISRSHTRKRWLVLPGGEWLLRATATMSLVFRHCHLLLLCHPRFHPVITLNPSLPVSCNISLILFLVPEKFYVLLLLP